MNKPDNTLRILVTVSSILFLLIAIKSSYLTDDVLEMTLNIAGKFVTYELILFSAIYVAGQLVSDALPDIYKICVTSWNKLRHSLSKNSSRETLLLPSYDKITSSKEAQVNGVISENCSEINHSENNSNISSQKTELSKEIVYYITKTFENILTLDNIEKLLNNFRKLNSGGPYEVIEKKKLDTVLEFDLAHFAWNVCKRIYDKNLCPLIFTVATAEMIKASFPLTLINYEIDTLKQRLRDSSLPTKFSLPIIEIGEELVPFDWQQKTDKDKI